jgi:hypothetical protein
VRRECHCQSQRSLLSLHLRRHNGQARISRTRYSAQRSINNKVVQAVGSRSDDEETLLALDSRMNLTASLTTPPQVIVSSATARSFSRMKSPYEPRSKNSFAGKHFVRVIDFRLQHSRHDLHAGFFQYARMVSRHGMDFDAGVIAGSPPPSRGRAG